MWGRAAFILSWVLPGLLCFSSCGGGAEDEKAAAKVTATAPPKDYPVLTLAPRTTTLFTEYPASIQGQQDIEIRPKIDGYIDRIYVDEGANVKKGQRLFLIFAPQYEQEVRTAEANIKIAQAEVNAAEMEVKRVRPLVEKNIISKYELESAEYRLQAKQAALAQARATLVNARTNLGYTSISSPANGIVGTIPYKIGSLVSSNTPEPLTTVSNISNIYAYFSINERLLLDFMEYAAARKTEAKLPPVTLVLANGEAYPRKGRIEATSGSIAPGTGSIRVRATFPNPNNLIRSGSTGMIRIPTTVDSALLVPQKATYEIQGKRFVYVVDDAGTVRSAEIQVLENDDGRFYVVEEGLEPGDRIVAEGVASLREGAPIKPVEVSADSVYGQGKSRTSASL